MTSFSIFRQIEKNQENLSKGLNTFENIMGNGVFAPNIIDNGAFAQRSKCSIFHNTFKNMIFQRRQYALFWRKELNPIVVVIIFFSPSI